MVWIKALFAGFALVIAIALMGVILMPVVLRLLVGQSVAVDVLSMLKNPVVWLVLGTGFLAGFYWEYQRALP